MQVKDVMHKGVQWVEPSAPLTEIAKLMARHNIGSVPIGENDRLVGMVTDRDIVTRGLAANLDLVKATARDVMSKGIYWCKETDDVREAAEIMEKNRVRRLPVLNKDKRMVGMISIGDIAHTRDRDLCGQVLDRAAARAA